MAQVLKRPARNANLAEAREKALESRRAKSQRLVEEREAACKFSFSPSVISNSVTKITQVSLGIVADIPNFLSTSLRDVGASVLSSSLPKKFFLGKLGVSRASKDDQASALDMGRKTLGSSLKRLAAYGWCVTRSFRHQLAVILRQNRSKVGYRCRLLHVG